MEYSPKNSRQPLGAADLRSKDRLVNYCRGLHREEPNQQGSSLRPGIKHSGDPSNSGVCDVPAGFSAENTEKQNLIKKKIKVKK